MPRKPSKKTLRNKLDSLWSKIIRSKGYCTRCGKTGRLEAAHIYSRRFVATRWDLDNGLCLCSACHRWGHDKPLDFSVYVLNTIGETTVERLRRTAHKLTQKYDYEKRLEELKRKAEDLDCL